MVDITGLVPLTIGGIVALLINVVIITVILAITDKFLAHEISIKNSLIMALIAYLAAPIILVFANITFPYSGYVIPLVIWVALGELLLKGSRAGRLKAAAVAFIIFLVLNLAGVPLMIAGFIPV